MHWNTTGATRTVLLVGPYAIKFPGRWVWASRAQWWRCFLNGLLANAQEREWSTVENFRAVLCPVVWSLPGGWCVVMRRATPLTSDEWYEFRERESNSDVLYTNDRWDTAYYLAFDSQIVPGEVKESSLGMLDGRIVVVDYGN